MDRRKFLSGVGTVGTIGAVATGFAVHDSGATKARAGGLARAAGAGSRGVPASARPGKALAADGMMLGYLPGSAGMLASPTVERMMRASATGLRWSRWDPALAAQTSQSAVHSLFRVSSLVDLSIGVLRKAGNADTGRLTGLDITAHFALDDAPYFAPFTPWRYEAAKPRTPPKSARFLARIPDRVALEVNYALRPGAFAGGISGAGMLYLPIGANAATTGLATGLYVLATTSAHTGVLPDLGAYVFSGDVQAPLADPSGRALDFDYLALAIRPVAI